jgi:copper chaperone CopZ
MRIIVDKYTKHFFDLAHCLVTNDHVQAPRTLHLKLKQSDKWKHRFVTHRSNSTNSNGEDNDNYDEDDLSTSMNSRPQQKQSSPLPFPAEELAHLTPLERMHIIQKNALQQELAADQNRSSSSGASNNNNNNKVIHIKGKCLPGRIDLPGIVDAVNRHATNLAHRGSSGSVADGGTMENGDVSAQEQEYGDPATTPFIFVSSRNEYIIVLNVEGITCAHCVKIVETVLKGCAGANSMNGNKSPINGLLDAAADHGVSSVIILIDHPSNAKRIAYESKRNLSLVGYVAKAINFPLDSLVSDGSSVGDGAIPSRQSLQRDLIQRSMIDIAKAYPIDFFDFQAPCTCPDSGVYRMNCPRYVGTVCFQPVPFVGRDLTLKNIQISRHRFSSSRHGATVNH